MTDSPEPKSSLLIYDGRISGQGVKVLIDSGANGLFISENCLNRLGLSQYARKSTINVRLADGRIATSSKVVLLSYSIQGYVGYDTFHVLPMGSSAHDLILGKPWLDRVNPSIKWADCSMKIRVQEGGKHKIIRLFSSPTDETSSYYRDNLILSTAQLKKALHDGEDYLMVTVKPIKDNGDIDLFGISEDPGMPDLLGLPVDWLKQIHALLSEFPTVLPTLNSPGEEVKPTYAHCKDRSFQHTIELTPGAEPPCRGMYRMSPAEIEELKAQIKDLIERGLIQTSTSPYGAPVLFVRKKNGKLRMVVDYRMLNNITVKNRYPLPRIDDLLDQLHGAKVFSKIDLASGYHLIPVAEEDRPKTAFRTRFGSYEFKVLPFGLCNAPSTFQRMMNDILRPYLDKFVIVYLDDICIFSKTPEEHLKHLQLVLTALKEHNLIAQATKCEFGVQSMDFLGHVISPSGLQPDPGKIKSILEWPAPKNKTEVLAFKGLAGFYRRFVQNFSKIAAPLSALTGNVPFLWTHVEQQAFETLKKALTTAPILTAPDFTRPFILRCDASDFAIGQVLCQGEGKEERVVAYESRKLTPAELKYPAHDKELLSLVYALKKFKHYLRSGRFKAITDNTATKYIQTKPTELNNRQIRWLDLLQEFDMDLIHKPGKTNVVADALSRRPDYRINAITRLSIQPPSDFLHKVKLASSEDPEYLRVLDGVQKDKRTDFRIHDGLLYKGHTRLYVPLSDLRETLLHDTHDSPICGHLGSEKTYERLARSFYWPKMHAAVLSYCRTCPSCQAIKPSHQKPMGLLQPLPIPETPWSSVSLDLITQLPKTQRGNTAIVVFVCRGTKMIICEPTTDNVTALELASLFHRAVFRHFGMPSDLISDRDSKFTSDFWQSFHDRLGVKLGIATTRHPQTDGQTEKDNQTLEDILRAYVSPYHDDWDLHLTAAEFAYNDSLNATTGYTPFYLNYGRHPRTPITMQFKPLTDSGPEPVREMAMRIKEDRENAQLAMKNAQARQAKYANMTRRDYTFEVGEKAWVSAKYFRPDYAQNAKKKFQPRYFGPYTVTEVISHLAYRLDLPKSTKVHPVIHISFLKANADGSQDFPLRPAYITPPPPEIEDGEEYFHVEDFRTHRYYRRKLQFLVKWKDHPEDANEYINAHQLQQDMTDTYQTVLDRYLTRFNITL